MASPTMGARIRASRNILNITQIELAHRMGDKTSSDVSRWERDVATPSEDKLALLQKHLFTPADKLSGEIVRVAGEADLPNPPKLPKPHTKEQLILSLVELGREKGKYKTVMDLLLGAKAQGYTLDTLMTLMAQIEP